jgi:hypothetical protein
MHSEGHRMSLLAVARQMDGMHTYARLRGQGCGIVEYLGSVT